MGEAAKRIATYADIEALPPHLVGEIIDGELHTMSRPAPKNVNAQSCLLSWTNARYQMGNGGPGGWWILTEPEIRLHGDCIVPDIAGWKRTRLEELPDTSYFAIAPDWGCEVLSPSTTGYDRVKKMAMYAREGVPHAWLLDPLERVLEVFALENARWVRVAACFENEQARIPPFEDVELDLALLWSGKRR